MKAIAWHKIAVVLLAIMIAVTGCGNANETIMTNEASNETTQETTNEVPVQSDAVQIKPIIRLAGGDTGLPNPYLHHTRGPGMSKMQLLYDTLIEIDENGYIPWLASSYSVDESGKVYTFNLVENAVWHDGTPLTVEDVLFTFDYATKHKPVTDLLTAGGQSIVEKIEKTGDYQFVITVNDVSNSTLANIGGVRILPKHIWENVEDPYSFTGEGATVASGPYKLEHYDPVKGEYRYVAFDAYWGPEPAVSAIEWIPVSDNILAFENEEIDLINAAADLIERYESDSNYTVRKLPSFHAYRLMMNIDGMEAFKDVDVRQAIAYAVDRQALIDKVARGNADLSSMGYIPSTSTWYNPQIENYAYDVEKSKTLLNGREYAFKLLVGNTATEVKMAELIKLDLEKVGITVTIESVETTVRDEALKEGKFELLLINSGGMGGDPDYLKPVYGTLDNEGNPVASTTIAGYQNQRIMELLYEQSMTLEDSARAILLNEAQMLIAEDVPMILLMSINDNFVYRQSHYSGWYARFNHSKLDHNKLSYVIRE